MVGEGRRWGRWKLNSGDNITPDDAPRTGHRRSPLVRVAMPNKSFHRNPPEMLPPHSPPAAQHADDAVRLTDDDAASSRLYVSRLRAPSTAPDHAACSSAAQAGYLHDPFASLLYKAPMSQPGAVPPQGASRARKPPLINVGTHHRTWGIDLLVDRFLQSGGKQVVSLGAGSDTRFWRLMVRPSGLV